MKMLLLVLVLLTLSGVLTQIRDWGVKYPDKPICAVRGFSVSIPCYYSYPSDGYSVVQKLWCSMNSNTDFCKNPPYVYDSSLNTNQSDFEFTGDDKSDCTLLIHNVQFNYSGVYKYRFLTDVNGGKWTGEPGATLQVTDLKVSLIRLSGNGTLKQGDSLNLTCDVNCTHTSSQFVWSKNNQRLYTSGPVLHFPALTLRDSGNYTCTWGNGETSGSETISLHVEDNDTENPERWLMWVIVGVSSGVIVVITGAVIHKRRNVHTEQKNENNSGTYNNVQKDEDDSAIYTNVQKDEDDSAIYTNVQKDEDDSAIYANV